MIEPIDSPAEHDRYICENCRSVFLFNERTSYGVSSDPDLLFCCESCAMDWENKQLEKHTGD